MNEPDSNTMPAAELALRRRRAMRTAWVAAAIAVAVYVTFILSGVLGR